MTTGAKRLFPPAGVLFNPVKVRLAPQEQGTAGDGRGGPETAVEFIGCKHLVFSSRLQDRGGSFLAAEIDAVTNLDRRRTEITS